MRKRKRAFLSVEQLEDRINPGIIVSAPGAMTGLVSLSGPGLANNVTNLVPYARTNYGVEQPNNDDTGFKKNYWSSGLASQVQIILTWFFR